MEKYLRSTKYIDWNHPEILTKAKDLSNNLVSEEEIAESCFIFVRDEIKHSNDFKMNPVTVTASEVLKHKTGYCYAKSHLLAALLRANKIPSGLCYQRLTIDNNKPPFCLHGLNAVYLQKHGWYRIDARGNKKNVHAYFCPPKEQIAFPVMTKGECDIQGIWPEPLPIVTQILEKQNTYLEVLNNLPDIAIINA